MPLPVYLSDLITEFKELKPPTRCPPALLDDAWYLYVRKAIDILIYIWTRVWDPSPENTIGDPTMCFLALASIKSDSSWASAVEVTPVIARLFFCMRAVFLFNLYLDDPTPEIVRERHLDLEQWHYEGTYSTFSSLCTLQRAASAIAFATPSLPAFIWFDPDKTEFIWRGSLVTVGAFRAFGQELMRRVYEGFKKVTFGFNFQIAGYIADDLSNTTPGYGFMTDSRNKKLHQRRTLYDAIMANPILRQQFLIAVSPDGVPVLNLGRLRQWLHDYSDVLLIYMALIEVEAGSPSRGTEITCIQLRNTACRTRGLYVIGRHLALVVQYSKTSATKGRDTLIPHVLDAFSQEYAKIVGFVMHPFAEQVVKILFPGRTSLLSLWRTTLFVKFDRLYKTEELSSILRVASLTTMGVEIGVHDYRQMSVCVRRAHCPRLDELINFGDEEDAASLQSGHSRATEERLYGVSAGYLGQLLENMVEPFANASAEWQVLMRVPEGGKSVNLDDFPVAAAWNRYLPSEKRAHVCCGCTQARPITLDDKETEVDHTTELPPIQSLPSPDDYMRIEENVTTSSAIGEPFSCSSSVDQISKPVPSSKLHAMLPDTSHNVYADRINHQCSTAFGSAASSDADLWGQLSNKVDDEILQDILSKVSQNEAACATPRIEVQCSYEQI